MWRSEEDVIKDLASLDDFGVPGDREPYQVLYSIGRGSKLHKKTENPKTFVDHRTGETIDIKDVPLDLNDTCTQGKGRGSAIGSLSKTKFQLLKQLRLARPLGSGDEAIESYYRRNHPVENSDSKPKTTAVEITSDNKDVLSNQVSSNTDKNRIKIKAIRHSNLQSNALIEGLLSKAKKNADLNTEEQGRSSDFSSEGSIEKNNVNPSGFPSDGASVENDLSTEILSSNYDSDNFSDAENTDSNNGKDNDSQSFDNAPCLSTTRCVSPDKNQDDEEKYKRLGEKLKMSEKIAKTHNGEGIYDFSCYKKYILHEKLDSNVPEIVFAKPAVKTFVFNKDEFPPLVKNDHTKK